MKLNKEEKVLAAFKEFNKREFDSELSLADLESEFTVYDDNLIHYVEPKLELPVAYNEHSENIIIQSTYCVTDKVERTEFSILNPKQDTQYTILVEYPLDLETMIEDFNASYDDFINSQVDLVCSPNGEDITELWDQLEEELDFDSSIKQMFEGVTSVTDSNFGNSTRFEFTIEQL